MVYRKIGCNTDSPTERTVFSLRIFTDGGDYSCTGEDYGYIA